MVYGNIILLMLVVYKNQ